MAEYIERESLVEDIKQYSHARIDNGAIGQMGFQFVEEMISILRIVEKQPTVDVAEVVRCKDCQSYSDFDTTKCKRLEFHFCDKFGIITKESDFCSYGKRKEGAE